MTSERRAHVSCTSAARSKPDSRRRAPRVERSRSSAGRDLRLAARATHASALQASTRARETRARSTPRERGSTSRVAHRGRRRRATSSSSAATRSKVGVARAFDRAELAAADRPIERSIRGK
eukprot:31286-Pelagococcus_subviridis.AAC.7